MTGTGTIRRIAIVAGIVCLVACGRDGATGGRPAVSSGDGLAFSKVRIASLPDSEDGAAEACDAGLPSFLALAAPGIDPLPAGSALSIAIGCTSSSRPGAIDLRVVVELEVPLQDGPTDPFDGMSEGRCPTDGSLQTFLCPARLVRRAVDEALSQRIVSSASNDELLALLARFETLPRVELLTALDAAGDRGLRKAVPVVVRLLGSPDADVALRAVGCAGRLGDPAALPALGRLALSKAPEVPYVALRAIGDIGGVEARKALEMVRLSATDPYVVREASAILSEDADRKGD